MIAWLHVCVACLLPMGLFEENQELTKLSGEWHAVSVERDGSSIPSLFLGKMQRITKGDETVVYRNGDLYLKSKFSVGMAGKNKSIDFDVTAGDDKGKKMLGIYEINNDTLKICYGPADKGRPTSYSTKSGSGQVSSVWKLKKK